MIRKLIYYFGGMAVIVPLFLAACNNQKADCAKVAPIAENVYTRDAVQRNEQVADVGEYQETIHMQLIGDTLHIGSGNEANDHTLRIQHKNVIIKSKGLLQQSLLIFPAVLSVKIENAGVVRFTDILRSFPNVKTLEISKGCAIVDSSGSDLPSGIQEFIALDCDITGYRNLYRALHATRVKEVALRITTENGINGLSCLTSVTDVTLMLCAPITDVSELFRMRHLRYLEMLNVRFMSMELLMKLERQKKFEFEYLYPFK